MPLNVLFVEDLSADAELAVAVLRRTWPKADWRRVESEAEFRAELDREPDVIVADYEVPGFGALPALRILRALGNHTPLIVCTGAVCEETAVHCMREGAADYLLKDRLTRLGPAVANALQLRRERAEKLRAERELRHLSNAMQHLTDGVVITDASLRLVTINKAFAAMTGCVAADAQGQSLRDVLGNDSYSESDQDLRAQIPPGGWRREIELCRTNGERIPALLSLSPVCNEREEIEYYSAVVTDLSSLRNIEHRIEYLSQHDALTGLPNRAALEAELGRRIVSPRHASNMAALLVVELDDFKAVNDTLCHRTGDLLINAVAERLNQLKLPHVVLARLGGDEFALLKPGRPSTVLPFAERLRKALERPFVIEGQELFITASIGVSCYPRDGGDFDSLLRAADAAVYQAKQKGRNAVSLYSAEESAAASERFMLQHALPQALARNELQLEYQPTVDLNTGKVTSVEALLRWRHPQLGLVPPGRFISIAEDSGTIMQISEWVMHSACAQLQRWQATGWEYPRVAVNVSTRQFAQADLPRRVAQAIREYHLTPDQLCLEITESMVMSDPLAAAETIAELSSMGVHIALDDFGTGYSSLSYLKRFRVDCLKVDRSFVSGVPTNADDKSIVRAVVALGKTLAMKIVAEGVETQEQARFLREVGCNDAQGFLYSRPAAAERVPALVTELPRRYHEEFVLGI